MIECIHRGPNRADDDYLDCSTSGKRDEPESLLSWATNACREVRSWRADSCGAWSWAPPPLSGRDDRLLAEACAFLADDDRDAEQMCGGRSGCFADAVLYVAYRARTMVAGVLLLAVFVFGAATMAVRSVAFLVHRLAVARSRTLQHAAADRCESSCDPGHPSSATTAGYAVWIEFVGHVVVVLSVNLAALYLVYAPVYRVLVAVTRGSTYIAASSFGRL